MDQIIERRHEMTNKLIKQRQTEYDIIHYTSKNPTDKFVCAVCGGHYMRRAKAIHDNGKKHQKALGTIYDTIDNLFLKIF